MTLRTVGESGLIAGIARLLAGGRGPAPAIGIGDDAAGWLQPPALVVASADLLVEGVHFDLALTGWRDLGWKALAVNLSDLAAMGAAPAWALVSLALRPDTDVEDVYGFYRGMRELAGQVGCAVAGGDTVAAPHEHVVSVAVLGTIPAAEAPTALRRGAGRAGDRVAVTGYLGASAAGLCALREARAALSASRQGTALAGARRRAVPKRGDPAVASLQWTAAGPAPQSKIRGPAPAGDPKSKIPTALADAHRRPQPQLAAGQILRRAGVRCAMDISDGLLADLDKLCAASGTGAAVWAHLLPLHPAAVEAYPDRALDWAAGGGEDYQLLFAAPPAEMAAARADLAAAGILATEIGELRQPAEGVRLLDQDGRELPVARRGWDHFAG